MIKIILDNKYELGGGMGCWAKSFENNIKVGHVRVIGGKLMKATYVYIKRWKPNEVWWTPVDENRESTDWDAMKEWIKRKV